MSRWDGSLEIQRRVLEVQQVAAQAGISHHVIANMEMREWEDHLRDQLVYQLRSFFYAERLADDVTDVHFTRIVPSVDTEVIKYREPMTWWDHWKRDKAPQWLRKRLRPVRWHSSWTTRQFARERPVTIQERVTVQRRVGYPDATFVPAPEAKFGRPLYFEQIVTPS